VENKEKASSDELELLQKKKRVEGEKRDGLDYVGDIRGKKRGRRSQVLRNNFMVLTSASAKN